MSITRPRALVVDGLGAMHAIGRGEISFELCQRHGIPCTVCPHCFTVHKINFRVWPREASYIDLVSRELPPQTIAGLQYPGIVYSYVESARRLSCRGDTRVWLRFDLTTSDHVGSPWPLTYRDTLGHRPSAGRWRNRGPYGPPQQSFETLQSYLFFVSGDRFGQRCGLATLRMKLQPGIIPSQVLGFWDKNTMPFASTIAFHRNLLSITSI